MGKSFQAHLQNLADVFQRFREYGFRLKAKTCVLFRTEVEYLGRTVGRNGMKISKHFLNTMEKWQVPNCSKEVERFCGFDKYHRNFIKGFAEISTPLYRFRRKNKFQMEQEHQDAFEILKSALCGAHVLTIPTQTGRFILDTDVSEFAMGEELLQVQNREERCISYCSFSFTPEQRRYCTTRK